MWAFSNIMFEPFPSKVALKECSIKFSLLKKTKLVQDAFGPQEDIHFKLIIISTFSSMMISRNSCLWRESTNVGVLNVLLGPNDYQNNDLLMINVILVSITIS